MSAHLIGGHRFQQPNTSVEVIQLGIKDHDDLLIKINDQIYLAKNDPDFIRKYALHFPKDGAGLLKYAEQLAVEGQHEKASLYYTKASEQGVHVLNETENALEQEAMALLSKRKAEASKRFKQTDKRLKQTLKGSLLLLLILLLLLFLKNCSAATTAPSPAEPPLLVYDESIPSPFQSDGVPPVPTNNPYLKSSERNRSYTINELRYMVAYNAIHRYKEERGEFPTSLTDLTQDNPENWISGLSRDLIYATNGTDFLLSLKGVEHSLGLDTSHSPLPSSLFELHFYPASNQLGFVSNNQLLALYSVASGKEPLPFTENQVMHRVVEPNGKESALGSRGLALADNYAIHGTNNPESIGRYLTAGCLRLGNTAIEELYPYVPKGTTFRVREDVSPGTPMYQLGLPPLLESDHSFKGETTPNEEYVWKN